MRKWILFAAVFILCFSTPYLLSLQIFLPLVVKAIERKRGITLTLQNASFSWLGPQKLEHVQWEDAHIEEVLIQAPFWSFSGPLFIKNASVMYQGKEIDLVNGKLERSYLDIQGHRIMIKGIFQSKQKFDLTLDLKDFPIDIPALGDLLSLQGTLKPEHIDLEIKTPNLQTHFIGAMSRDGFTLKAPLLAALHITEHLIPRVESKTQALFKIEAQDAFFPWPFSLEKLRCKGRADLGQIYYEGDHATAALIAFLKTELPKSHIDIWFAPADFSIQEGVLNLGRLDFLFANQFPLCVWGSANVVKDQLNMNLGLSAITLAKAFGINNLDSDYVLKVPVRGSFEDPDIEKKQTALKLTTLVALNRVPTRGVLGKVTSSAAKKEADIPPANHPFPWEK